MNLKLETEFSKAEILKEVDALKKQIDDMRPLPADVESRIMQNLRLGWNLHSNAIEGNELSYNEVKAFLTEGIVAEGKPLKDHLEIQGHDEAINFLLSIAKETRPMNEADIRSLHKMILVEPYDIKAQTADGLPTTKRITLGEYKTIPNHVKTTTGEIHYYSTPEETPAKMQELMGWYAETSANSGIHPVIIAALFHHKFVSIHPFDDGNGRLSRILMNLILMQKGFPPVVINLNDSQNYYSLLSMADNGDCWPFVEYISDCLKDSLQMFLDWKHYRYQVSVNGIISSMSKKMIDKGFKIKGDEKHTLDLFCRYSNLEIPIGATFNYFEKNNVLSPLKNEAVLIAVTQQFGKPFEVIPEGWKTISKFEFSEEDVSNLKNELPVLNTWTSLDDKCYLLKIEYPKN
jgi:Fic family protein